MDHKIRVVFYEDTCDESYTNYMFKGEHISSWDISDGALFLSFDNKNAIRIRLDTIVGIDNIIFSLMDAPVRITRVTEAINEFIAPDVRGNLM